MKEKDEAFKIDHYINLVFKHRWLIIIPFCLCMIVGICLAITLPKTYEATALVLVKPQQVPADFARDIETADIGFRVKTMAKQILSHPNLEKIIDDYNLFSDPEQQDMFIEEKIADLKQRIDIQILASGTRKGADAFYIIFQWPIPQQAAMVANSLATLFIEEDLKERETEAVDTTQFLDEQLGPMRERLKELETRLSDYRNRNMGELPEQLNTNLRMMDSLQAQLSQHEKRLRDSKNQLAMLEIEIQATKESLAGGAIVSERGEELTLPDLKNRLYTLKASYTDNHPDVIRLKAMIADMEAKLKSGEIKSSGNTNINTALTEEQLLTTKKLNEQIRQQSIKKIEINDLEDDIREINNEIWKYQQRIERTPKREEELKILNRDYQNMQNSYNSLLNRKLEAEIAVNMEKKQKGEQFSILESAKVPHEPVSPNMKLLFILSFIAGLHIGPGLIFLRDYFNTSLKDPNDFESDLGVNVLATIPKIYRKKDLRLKRLNQLMTGVSIVAAVCLFSGFAMLAILGVEQTIEIVQNPSVLWETKNSLSQ
jgi:polysaccharide chain length determinant protein (PEP-CTERM system associated)